MWRPFDAAVLLAYLALASDGSPHEPSMIGGLEGSFIIRMEEVK